eukprot:scaffold323_cov363-Pavlova_lutheri.AAC.2
MNGRWGLQAAMCGHEVGGRTGSDPRGMHADGKEFNKVAIIGGTQRGGGSKAWTALEMARRVFDGHHVTLGNGSGPRMGDGRAGRTPCCSSPVLQSHLGRGGGDLSCGLLQQLQSIGAVRATLQHRLVLREQALEAVQSHTGHLHVPGLEQLLLRAKDQGMHHGLGHGGLELIAHRRHVGGHVRGDAAQVQLFRGDTFRGRADRHAVQRANVERLRAGVAPGHLRADHPAEEFRREVGGFHLHHDGDHALGVVLLGVQGRVGHPLHLRA